MRTVTTDAKQYLIVIFAVFLLVDSIRAEMPGENAPRLLLGKSYVSPPRTRWSADTSSPTTAKKSRVKDTTGSSEDPTWDKVILTAGEVQRERAAGKPPMIAADREPENKPVHQRVPAEGHDESDGHHPGPLTAFEREGYKDLPSNYQPPHPLTLWQEFLGSDAIKIWPKLHWFGDGNQITPALTAYGSYNVFATAFQQDRNEVVGIGHQFLLEVDFSLGATERIHAQWRPFGEKNTGGSLLQLNEDVRYADNGSALPQRLWLEADISEIFSGYFSDLALVDVAISAGLFPYSLHNQLLINDDIVGVIVSKNDIIFEPFSKILVQFLGAFDEIDAFANEDNIRLYGAHAIIDWKTRNVELTYLRVFDATDPARNQDYFGASVVQLWGVWNFAGRALFQLGDEARDGAGQLYVLEANYTRYLQEPLGTFDTYLVYCNAFWATEGWQSISGGNFDRLRGAFAVNPLVQLSLRQGRTPRTAGIAAGVELFLLHKDLAIIPEIALEFPEPDEVLGLGGRIRYKISKQSQLELRGLLSFTGADDLRRDGLFLEWTVFF